MSKETQILALFEEANPVPDDQVMVRSDAEPAAYLATLQQRSSDVIQIDERAEEQKTTRKPWLIAATAAALVVVAGAMAFLLNQGETEEAPVVTQPSAEPGTIEGYWSGEEADFYFGESEYAIVIDGVLSDSGTYVAGVRDADNRIVTITSGDESVDCSPGDVAVINYDFVGGDAVQLSGTPVDECGLRPLLDVETLNPTEPFEIPEPIDALTPSALIGGWSDSNSDLVLDDTGYVLVLSGSVLDRGTFEVSGNSLALTSGPDSPQCEPGELKTWAVELTDDILALTNTSDDCGARNAAYGGARVLQSNPGVTIPGADLDIRLNGTWLAGSLAISFEDGEYSIADDGENVDEGTYTMTAFPDQLAITTTRGDLCDVGNSRTLAYQIDDRSLTLRGDSDECLGRLNLLTNEIVLVSSASR